MPQNQATIYRTILLFHESLKIHFIDLINWDQICEIETGVAIISNAFIKSEVIKYKCGRTQIEILMAIGRVLRREFLFDISI